MRNRNTKSKDGSISPRINDVIIATNCRMICKIKQISLEEFVTKCIENGIRAEKEEMSKEEVIHLSELVTVELFNFAKAEKR